MRVADASLHGRWPGPRQRESWPLDAVEDADYGDLAGALLADHVVAEQDGLGRWTWQLGIAAVGLGCAHGLASLCDAPVQVQ